MTRIEKFLPQNVSIKLGLAMRQHFVRPAVKGQQPGDRRGYFYESVGGVYYTLEWPLKVRIF